MGPQLKTAFRFYVAVMSKAFKEGLQLVPMIPRGAGKALIVAEILHCRPNCKNFHWLPERLASLGIMGDQLRVPLKPLNTIVL